MKFVPIWMNLRNVPNTLTECKSFNRLRRRRTERKREGVSASQSILCCTSVAWRLEESLVIYISQDSNIMWIVQAYGRLVYHREGLGNAYAGILAKHGDGAISSPQ
ncbi:hypothetical protein C5167_035528 [Papaver somniferum]|uniref:Uncharacterized protein n=1 Tax=Papaver somniferum TaxID=3469 RepID=A0A4Y7KJI8_PAPSO|nr:hypothetical protein C5167_035528 [Papaver somniferum]